MHFDNLAKKGLRSANSLRIIGFHARGFPPVFSRRVYQTFVRPTMEYGLGILHPPAEDFKILDRCQASILRRLLGAPHCTSIPALHLIFSLHLVFLLPTMTHRGLHLFIKTMARFHDASQDGLIHHFIQLDQRRCPSGSLYCRLRKVSLRKELLEKRDMGKAFRDDLKRLQILPHAEAECFRKLQTKGVIAQNISVRFQPHPILSRPVSIPRSQHRRMILHLLGVMIGKPQPCRRCCSLNIDPPPLATRQHVVTCLNLPPLLMRLLNRSNLDDLPESPLETALDTCFDMTIRWNRFRDINFFWIELSRLVEYIWKACLGRRR